MELGDDINAKDHDDFKPFRVNGEESSLFIVYKAFTAKYEGVEALHKVKDFCLTSTSPENQRKSLEFLYMSNFFGKLDDMIAINQTSEVIENQQWAQLFSILINRRRKKLDHFQVLKNIENIQSASLYVEIYKRFVRVYSFQELRETGKAANELANISDLMEEVEDPLMKKYTQERLEDFQFFYHFFRNELILCRMYGYRLLKEPHNIYKHCLVHKNLALTYLFEDYGQTMYHMQEALNIAREKGFTLLEKGLTNKNLPFIAAITGHCEGVTTTDPIEQAHLNIAKGNIAEAVEVLQNIETPSHYQEYYLGKALQDQSLLMNAYNRFMQQGDFFGAKLPFIELQKLKEGYQEQTFQNGISS